MLNSFSWLEWRKSKPNGRAALCLSAADYISSWEMLPGVVKCDMRVVGVDTSFAKVVA